MNTPSFKEIRNNIERSSKIADPRKITGSAKVLQAAIRAIKNTRYTPMAVECRRAPGEQPFYASGVSITSVELDVVVDGFTIGCEVHLRSASGVTAIGIGGAVKGRKDTFDAAVGASHALKQAMEGAFTVLGQVERTRLSPSPFSKDYKIPVDEIVIDNFHNLHGVEMLFHAANQEEDN